MKRFPIAGVLLAWSFLAAAQTATQKQELISGLALPDDAQISFLDSDGKPVDYAAFMQLASHGASFSTRKNPAAHTAVLQITPRHVASQPAAWPLAVAAGSALPAFSLQTAQGHALRNAGLAGHYTVLSFYFADCAPCIAEVPSLNALARQRQDLRVLPVTFESRQVASDFARRRHLQLDSLVGAQTLADSIGVASYPTLVLVDPSGHIAAATLGTSLAATPGAADIGRWVDRYRTH